MEIDTKQKKGARTDLKEERRRRRRRRRIRKVIKIR
jgi:hypothetical protein